MVFSSLVFLCIFLPITYVLYKVLPNTKWKNALLIVVSLLFYAYGEPVYVFLMIGSVVMNYVSALALVKCKNASKVLLAGNVILNLGMLALFKYAGFLVETINGIFKCQYV